MRSGLKGALEGVLLHGGPAGLSRRSLEGRALVLAYHNVVPHGQFVSGDLSLHLTQRRFADQLDLLLDEGIQVVPLEGLLKTAEGGRRVAITFDDAYRGALTAGAEELAARDLPATVFVAPGLLGGRTPWWDALAAGFSNGLPDEVRSAALVEAEGRTDRVLAWAAERGFQAREGPPHARTATEAELARAARTGIALASHTWSHPNLEGCDSRECRVELERSLHWLRDRFGTIVPWLAYPYGRLSSGAEEVARAAGYRGAFRIAGGWLPREPEEALLHRLPRLNVPATISRRGFALRLSGLLCG